MNKQSIKVMDISVMKNRRYCHTIIIVLFAALAVVAPVQGADDPVSAAMVGHWEGKARIIVSWCHQPDLPVVLDIHDDLSVTGRIGDGTLVAGRLTRNRGWFGRKLHLASDYIIKGDMEGPIVATENISRSGVNIILDYSDGKFVGGVHTSGSKFGGKEKMILSATDLTLTKQE